MIRNLLKPNPFISKLSKIKFPEKLKGTIIEKWADYWKNLCIDYRQMLQDLRSDIQEDPKKALKWTFGLVTICALAKNNPNEYDFKNNLKLLANQVILVSEDCLNPKSIDHIRFLESCYNEGLIHYKSIGIASIMYMTELNDSCDLYKAHCSYLKPTYSAFPSRIIDVGCLGRWWNIYIKTTNYDVN